MEDPVAMTLLGVPGGSEWRGVSSHAASPSAIGAVHRCERMRGLVDLVS